MGTVSFKPESALGYQGNTPLSNSNYWIGRPNGYSSAFTVRYTFRVPKKLRGFVATVSGRREGTVDGQFMYALSAAPDFPDDWKTAGASGDVITVTHTGELAPDTLWYFFISKSTTGNYVYYSGCSAENMTITGETVPGGHVYKNGEWKDAAAKVYRGGTWKDVVPGEYKGAWSELA